MRIVYLLLHDFRFASIGIQEFARRRFHFSKEYARRMALLGHDVKLYVLGEGASRTQFLRIDGYELKAFRASFSFPPLMKFGNTHSLEVLGEIRRDSPDIVHLHNYYLWNFPYIVPFAKNHGLPVVAQFHGTDPIRRLKAVAFYPSLRLCDRLLVPTASEERFLAEGLRIPGRRVERFPSTGVDVQIFHRADVHGGEQLLLYVGRVPLPSSYFWEKAPLYLLPILRLLLDRGVKTRLVVAGDGPGLEHMRSTAKRFEVHESVDFLGFLEQSKLPELYSRSRLTMVPIHMDDVEPFWGGTVQESLACGTPVVAFNNSRPGFKRFGLLVPTEARPAADLISMALADPQKLSAVRQDGPAFVNESCAWNVLTRRLDRIYGVLAK